MVEVVCECCMRVVERMTVSGVVMFSECECASECVGRERIGQGGIGGGMHL